MKTVRLIHWNAAEAKPRLAALRAAGYRVVYEDLTGATPAMLRKLRAKPPQAFVIDLTRLPSHGHAVGLTLRQAKITRHVPLVFVGGDPAKVARVRQALPDAAYTSWENVAGSLEKAIAAPPAKPVVPGSVMESYAGTPLVKKLGIKENFRVKLIGAPGGFWETLDSLPEGAVAQQGQGAADLLIWFVRSAAELEAHVAALAAGLGGVPVWIAWPKQASGVRTDLTQPRVREAGLAEGLVDYKVCAIDATWSGLLFRKRKAAPARKREPRQRSAHA